MGVSDRTSCVCTMARGELDVYKRREKERLGARQLAWRGGCLRIEIWRSLRLGDGSGGLGFGERNFWTDGLMGDKKCICIFGGFSR